MLRGVLRICISNKFLADVDVAGLDHTGKILKQWLRSLKRRGR